MKLKDIIQNDFYRDAASVLQCIRKPFLMIDPKDMQISVLIPIFNGWDIIGDLNETVIWGMRGNGQPVFFERR